LTSGSSGGRKAAEVRPRMRLLALGLCTIALLAASGVPAPEASPEGRRTCKPTLPGSRVPGYRPGAPVRSRVGAGHVLVGVVRSSRNCAPIAHARLELFQAGPLGYSVRPSWVGRATLFTRRNGSYRFESPVPSPYAGRPHIHVRASAPGFRTVFAVHELRRDETRGRLDLVLRPARP
jgi:hypothetical protein